MKHHTINYIIYTILILLLISCQKPYYPDNLDSGKNIPVVQGWIYNTPGPYEVTLFWASPFGNQQINPINDAVVYISDDYGNREQLTMTMPGHYFTSIDGIRGTPGHTYSLRIELSDGNIYESNPEKMNEIIEGDTLYESGYT